MLIGSNIKAAVQDSIMWLSVAVVVTLLMAAVFGLCLAALYFYVVGIFAPAIAALITAGGALVLIGLITAGIWLSTQIGSDGKKPRSSAPPDNLLQLLSPALLGQVAAWIKANPKTAATAGALAGVGVGLSPELRRLLLGLLGQRGSAP